MVSGHSDSPERRQAATPQLPQLAVPVQYGQWGGIVARGWARLWQKEVLKMRVRIPTARLFLSPLPAALSSHSTHPPLALQVSLSHAVSHKPFPGTHWAIFREDWTNLCVKNYQARQATPWRQTDFPTEIWKHTWLQHINNSSCQKSNTSGKGNDTNNDKKAQEVLAHFVLLYNCYQGRLCFPAVQQFSSTDCRTISSLPM